ncbi:hypothetical protein AHiyo6_09620, partial [Arthrobacter sp. Hiyo6]
MPGLVQSDLCRKLREDAHQRGKLSYGLSACPRLLERLVVRGASGR